MALNLPSYLKTAVKVVLSALSLWLVFRKIEPAKVWAVVSGAEVGWLLVATALFVLSKAVSSERLRVLFRSIGLSLRSRPNLKLYWLGMYYNLFLPGGIGGDGYKVFLLNRLTGTPMKPLVAATLLDRLLGLLPLLYALALFSAVVPQVSEWVGFTINWQALAAILVLHVSARRLLKRFMPQFLPVFSSSTALSGLVQGLQLGQILALMRAMDVNGDPRAYLLVFLISSIVATIPFTIGGAGARELTFLVGARMLNLPADAAVAISLLFYLITAVVSLTGVVYSFRSATLAKELGVERREGANPVRL
ncbi:lysylphosphatidylglycerol synthase transmembrane domain-containing protein [Larkinella soli]|uniref:lysylphosphatidylglycerol synthase transmembrane domain-containing protein n=1 Tax=Larkinella soli TaxID=1770527 RepID=UPI000FFB7288|nr:lysylphosphatidylglycerol synthase transmembrane domain-containing protein [Larkinella soli]